MSSTSGKRVGSRRADRKRSWPTRKSLLLALGVTVCVVAWGYLVLAAIDFGATARGGESRAWLFLGLACLGATACLFVGLMLGARLLRSLGIITDPPEPEPEPEPAADSLAGLSPRATLTVTPAKEEPTPPRKSASPASTTAPVPAPRQGDHPRGRRIADKPLNPDGPRPTGGRRIAR